MWAWIEPMPPAVEAQSLNHWTAREVLETGFLMMLLDSWNDHPTSTFLGMWEEFPRLKLFEGFPGGAVVKNPPANAGDTSSSPGPRRSHMPQSS